MIIKNANIFRSSGYFEEGNLYIHEEKLVSINEEDNDYIDATGMYAIPGLTDLHFHGCVGYDFCDASQEALVTIAEYQAKNGITTICPATMSLPEQQLTRICEAAAEYSSNDGAILCGINLEGPFISKQKKGAQNEDFITKPDISMFYRLNRASNDLIKILDLAPEEEGAMDIIRRLHSEIVISVAHTTADYNTAYKAFTSGARQVTHLYNAMPLLHHRDPGVIGAAFDSPECRVELICDGVHVHPSVIRATVQMFGADRVIFVSDSMMATGLSDGLYALGGQDVSVKGNRALLKDGTIAGSTTNLMQCLRIAVKEMGIPLEHAVKAAAVNPAKALGIYNRYGSLEYGKVANIVLLDKELNIMKVILRGIELNLE